MKHPALQLDRMSQTDTDRFGAGDAGAVKMKAIHYLQGDATSPQAKGNKVIAHICNDLGGWGKGFVLAVSQRWQEPERDYRKWHRERARNDFGLGAVQFVQVEPWIWVANMIGQRGMKTGSKGPPIRYDAVRDCLEKLAEFASWQAASVHMPRIGCGLAGGRWELILPIIEGSLSSRDVPVYVYDLA
jgi:O-acetyl-ADP-ribose deacetylase (regulator of RNase III)